MSAIGPSLAYTDIEKSHSVKVNLAPQRNGQFSPGGLPRTFYAPHLTNEELVAAICLQFVSDSANEECHTA